MLFYRANKLTNSKNGGVPEFFLCFFNIVYFNNKFKRLLKITNCHLLPLQNSKYVKKIENTSEC